MWLRASIVAVVVALIGVAACDTSPTEPSPVTTAAPTSGPSAGASDDGQLEALTLRLAQLESADVSPASLRELDRIRSLIATLTGELSSGGGNEPGGGGGTPPPGTPVTVSIVGQRGANSFSPNPIPAGGQMVTWRNDDAFMHRIVADDGSFDTGNLVAGATSAMVQPAAGGYHCSIHPSMVGSVGGGGGSGGDDGQYTALAVGDPDSR